MTLAEEIMPMGDSDAFFDRFNDNHQYMGLTVAEVAPDAARLRLTVTIRRLPVSVVVSMAGCWQPWWTAAVTAVFSKMLPGSLPAGTADLSGLLAPSSRCLAMPQRR